MNVNHILEVRNRDPIGALREFVALFWEQNEFDLLVAPTELPDRSGIVSRPIEEIGGLAMLNPFAPVMLSNAARITSKVIQENPAKRIAVILRPCELRAFIEIQKRSQIQLDSNSVVILGVDCIGTIERRQFVESLASRGFDGLTDDVLQNAAEGGLRPQKFRTACQVCDWPAPCGADIIIGAIGVTTDKHLLLIARNEAIDERLGLSKITSGRATEYQVSHRETVVGAIADVRSGVRRKLVEDLHTTYRFNDFASFLAWFANCSLCGECLNACPLYNGEFGGLLGLRNARESEKGPLAELVAISRWLVSCSGCGMCEETCNCQVPLTLLISALSHRIRGEMHYRCGDPQEQLPWVRSHS